MTKITVLVDCRNASKMEQIKDFIIALAKGDVKSVLSYFADDICWETVGRISWNGKEALTEVLNAMTKVQASELIIDNIVSDSMRGSANGVLKYKDGSTIAFCDMFTFTSQAKDAKIKTLIAYDIDISEDQ